MLTPQQKHRLRQLNADAEELVTQAAVGRVEQAMGKPPTFNPGLPLSFRDYVHNARQFRKLGALKHPDLPDILPTMGVSLEDFVALSEIDLDPWPPEWL